MQLILPNYSSWQDQSQGTIPAFLEGPVVSEKVKILLNFMRPVTLAYTNLQGRTIQLWKYKQTLVASLEEGDKIKLLSGGRIYNAFQPQENEKMLLNRFEETGIQGSSKQHLAIRSRPNSFKISIFNRLYSAFSALAACGSTFSGNAITIFFGRLGYQLPQNRVQIYWWHYKIRKMSYRMENKNNSQTALKMGWPHASVIYLFLILV